MYISVISSNEHRELVADLLSNSLDKLEYDLLNGESRPRIIVQRKLHSSDAVLIIIDNKFQDNQQLLELAKAASWVAKEGSIKVVIPIIIKDAKAPEFLSDLLSFTCDQTSRKDISRVRVGIRRILTRRINKKDKREKNYSLIALPITLEICAVLLALIFFVDTPFSINSNLYDNEALLFMGILSVLTALMALLFSLLYSIKKRNRDDDNEEIELYSRRLKRAIIPELSIDEIDPQSDKKEVDAIGRMMINLEDIKAFYTWSQSQAKAAFYLAMWMCIAGFLFILAAVVLPLAFNVGFEIAIIPTLGGVITELIAGTALIVYKSSLSQLNHYHQALHEDERFLSSVNLVSMFNSPETHDLMLQEIIRSEIQMNLNNTITGSSVINKESK